MGAALGGDRPGGAEDQAEEQDPAVWVRVTVAPMVARLHSVQTDQVGGHHRASMSRRQRMRRPSTTASSSAATNPGARDRSPTSVVNAAVARSTREVGRSRAGPAAIEGGGPPEVEADGGGALVEGEESRSEGRRWGGRWSWWRGRRRRRGWRGRRRR